MKLRIVIVVFTVILVFYFLQFLFSMMQKKEHFSTHYYDEIEKYEDAPKSGAPPKEHEYDLRIALLNEIDKLGITDSKAKSNIMESVFSELMMKKLKDMTPEQRSSEIKSIYETISKDTPPVKQETIVNKPLSEQLQQAVDNAKIPVPLLKDYYENDYRNKNSKILNKLDIAIDALKDMKDIMKDSHTKEPYIADLPIPPGSLLEGFENIKTFHHF